MAVPSTGKILIPSQHNVSEKKLLNRLPRTLPEEFTIRGASEYQIMANKLQTYRMLERNRSKPNLSSNSLLHPLRRDENQKIKSSKETGVNYRLHTIRSLEENKRWKEYRASQCRSHPIIWSSGGRCKNLQWTNFSS
jgi:hypothetical protein